jgi:dienelactone hydrolase
MKKYLLCLIFIALLFCNYIYSQPLPSIKKPIVIKEWQYAGPFETGAREGVVDALYSWGVEQPFDGYPSAFAEGGKVIWKKVKGDDSGNVELVISNAPWQVLGESWGIVGVNYVAFCKGYVYTDKRCRAMISSKHVMSFSINGRTTMPDYYGFNRWQPPVLLDSGQNVVLLKLTSYGDTIDFSFSILPDTNLIRIVSNDITFPDAVEKSSMDSWIGIPLINCTDLWFKEVSLKIGGDEYFKTEEVNNISIPPFGIIKIPVKLISTLNFPVVSKKKENNFVELTINANSSVNNFQSSYKLKIPLKSHSDDRRETFFSKIDNSVQFYGIKEPLNYDPTIEYGMIFTLHGAGVYALNQVGAYAPRDWAFVVAPTNRREYGFNWQEEGRLDAMEVLDVVKSRYIIDPDRIMLTGHSMGGHGAWHVGTFYSDQFAAFAPACGWMSIDMYIPNFLTKLSTYSTPELKHIWDIGFMPDRPQLCLNNLFNIPTLIMISGADDNVPPVHGRLFEESMLRLGMKPEVHDIPGKPHWFDDDKKRPGADVTDALFYENFYKDKVRNKYPEEVKFVMTDPAITDHFYWVKILDTYNYLEQAEVDAKWLDPRHIVVNSKNCSTLEITRPDNVPAGIYTSWNGSNNFISAEGQTFQLTALDWKQDTSLLTKAKLPGPMKRAYMKPFVIVIGSNTDENTFNSYLQAARQESIFWWYNANGYTEILTDKDAAPDKIKDKNLILIGTQEDNLLLKEKILKTPVKISDDGIFIDNNLITKGDYAVKFVYPDVDNPDQLILYSTGTNSKYVLLSETMAAYSVSSALPDMIVFNEKVKEFGFAGLTAAGYFDKDWKFDRELMYY